MRACIYIEGGGRFQKQPIHINILKAVVSATARSPASRWTVDASSNTNGRRISRSVVSVGCVSVLDIRISFSR